MYKISVVVATYNSGDFLITFLDSIKSQTLGFDDIEVIFVDDASTDRYTLGLLEEFSKKYSNVSAVFLDENSGFPGTSRNKGLDLASGEYVIFADHDDSYEKDAFEVMYDKIASENADFLFTNYNKVYENEVVREKTPFNGQNIAVDNFKEDLRLFDIGPSIWTKLFKKEFLVRENIRFLEGMLAEDMYVYIYALFKSKKTLYLDDFYGYNYSIRDVDGNKSTIHLRNKKYLASMVKGYEKIDELISMQHLDEYFSNIFKRHFVYWITSLVASDISDTQKRELIVAINPLLKKQVAITPDFDERIYSSLTKPILASDYDQIVKNIGKIKKSRARKNKIKNFLGF
jgi:poly(ribitol-phosphate) beta-N-acetylglucosaminyltransferase